MQNKSKACGIQTTTNSNMCSTNKLAAEDCDVQTGCGTLLRSWVQTDEVGFERGGSEGGERTRGNANETDLGYTTRKNGIKRGTTSNNHRESKAFVEQ